MVFRSWIEWAARIWSLRPAGWLSNPDHDGEIESAVIVPNAPGLDATASCRSRRAAKAHILPPQILVIGRQGVRKSTCAKDCSIGCSYHLFMDVAELLRVKPGASVDLSKIDASSTPGLEGPKEQEKAAAAMLLQQNGDAMQSLQYLLWAEQKQSLLVVLQGMDTAGKDGTIRHVFGVLNPQGVRVSAFKQPTERELAHDFLWRVHRATPAHGQIVVFNRSHYEDVTVVRVQNLAPKAIWSKRYDHINCFERVLVDGGTTIIKIFLHIDRDEQKKRIESRLADSTKAWKFAPSDVSERKHWDDYTEAYNDAIAKCSTEHAPWFIVPANRKWYRNWAISTITRQALERMNPRTPAAKFEAGSIKVD